MNPDWMSITRLVAAYPTPVMAVSMMMAGVIHSA